VYAVLIKGITLSSPTPTFNVSRKVHSILASKLPLHHTGLRNETAQLTLPLQKQLNTHPFHMAD